MAYQGFRPEVLDIWIPAANGTISAQLAMTLQITRERTYPLQGVETQLGAIYVRPIHKTMAVITVTCFKVSFQGSQT